MQITIVSGFTGESWTGSLLIVNEHGVLEYIFKLFQRIDEESAIWLDQMGFKQPSVSSGDIIIYRYEDELPKAFVVCSVGFEPITLFGPLSKLALSE